MHHKVNCWQALHHRPINTIASTSVVSHQSTCTRYEFPGRFAQFHPSSTLLILDRGFYDFGFFVRLINKSISLLGSNPMQRLKLSEFWVPTTRSRFVCFKTGDKTNHCYGCASSKSAKVKQCMVTSPQCRPTSSSTVCRCWLRTTVANWRGFHC